MARDAVAMALAAALLWQTGRPHPNPDPSVVAAAAPATQHLRYWRAVQRPTPAESEVCAVLDAAVFAHAAGRAGNDLRVFAEGPTPGAPPREVPFVLRESEAAPEELQTAAVRNARLDHGSLRFELAMPQRSYTAIDLQLAAKNFLATATVWGKLGPDRPATPLGVFTLFDLTAEGLPRSTVLPLQDASFPILQVRLSAWDLAGRRLPGLSPAMVQSATVPPSREAQTLYTTVAETAALQQRDGWSVATLHVPAHVPIERVTFLLARPAQGGDRAPAEFLRPVTVTANPDGVRGVGAYEAVEGEIWRVARRLPPASGAAGVEVQAEKLSADAVLAANLRAPATVAVALRNGAAAPLPLRAVALQMRQRSLCFHAAAGAAYTVRYGDPGLGPPGYTQIATPAAALDAQSPAQIAQLGPEQPNPGFVAQSDRRPYLVRHPEVLWVALLACVLALGALARHHVRGQHEDQDAERNDV